MFDIDTALYDRLFASCDWNAAKANHRKLFEQYVIILWSVLSASIVHLRTNLLY